MLRRAPRDKRSTRLAFSRYVEGFRATSRRPQSDSHRSITSVSCLPFFRSPFSFSTLSSSLRLSPSALPLAPPSSATKTSTSLTTTREPCADSPPSVMPTVPPAPSVRSPHRVRRRRGQRGRSRMEVKVWESRTGGEKSGRRRKRQKGSDEGA